MLCSLATGHRVHGHNWPDASPWPLRQHVFSLLQKQRNARCHKELPFYPAKMQERLRKALAEWVNSYTMDDWTEWVTSVNTHRTSVQEITCENDNVDEETWPTDWRIAG